MSIKVRKIADSSLFSFTCAQWAMMEPLDKADWEVIENLCGRVTLINNPYAASEFFYTLDGQVAAETPLRIATVDGISTILFEDQAAGTVLAGPVSGPDDYPTFRALELTDLPDLTETIQDAIGPILAHTDTVNFTYTDATPEIKADVRLQMSITSDASGVKLSGDAASPGNNKVYGTDASGVKGWKDDPAGGGLSDGDKGDITVSGSGTIWTIDDNVVSNAKIRDAAASSVIGRSAATGGDVADIVSGAATQVLRTNDSNVVEWGKIVTDYIVDAAITTAKIADSAVTTAKINDLAVTTGKVANDAVTYAKIQNVTATNRILGRIAAGAGDVQELTNTDVYTILGMTGTANRFALWTGANTLSSDAAFTFDAANDRMTIAGTVAGTGANNAFLNLNSGAIAGKTEFLRMSGNITNGLAAGMYNANNGAAAASSVYTLQTGGANGGDPFIQFIVASASNDWSIGVDNSDGDKFKITPKSTAPGSVVNSGLIITSAATALVGVNKDAPAHPLDVEGLARSRYYIGKSNEWAVGDFAAGTALNGGGSITNVTGCGNAFKVSFSTGTTPAANGNIFVCTFPAAVKPPFASFITFSSSSIASSNEWTKFYVSASSAVSFTFKSNGTLAASTEYAFYFSLWGSNNA